MMSVGGLLLFVSSLMLSDCVLVRCGVMSVVCMVSVL